ncbi:MAG: DNA polymerase/3'-5' exonuclease PolX [Verrucomicrobia bacterium]|nr:DNA polymerase/3'-5' exonuclease PolX [Verrucomicrobiota bacterium]
MTKDEVAAVLEAITQLLELKGENPFKIRAYQNAARAVETYSGNLEAAANEGRLTEIPGIGAAIAEKIALLIQTGHLPYYEELKAEFPPGIFVLFELMGVGPKKIRAVYDKLGIATLEELEAGCKDGRVAALSGFGAKTAANILQAIEQRQSVAGSFLLGDVAEAAEALYDDLRGHPDVSQAAIAGSYRRRKEVVHDLDFVVASLRPENVTEFFTTHPLVQSVIASGATKSSVRLRDGVQADLRVVSNAQFPFALNYFTGSKEHNIVLRGRALQHGWSLNEYRLSVVEEGRVKPEPIPEIVEERDLYGALGLDYIPPELRENLGEFAAAESHTLPDLIALENLRGTFHCHTTASDGRNSLEEMARAAQALGLQYLGIADHSKSSYQAHGLHEAQLLAQIEAIKELNATYADGFRLFAGVECDILKDGTLDFSDEILSQLDYVVASVHSVFNLPEAEMTERILKAISNPYVTILGHMTGRLLLSRKPYPLDIPAVIEAAAQTGTIIELNGNPQRLDMDWRWWPLAKEKGVRCAINPDAHSVGGFKHLWFGVQAARKGWLTRADVVNVLPLGKIEAVLAAKRSKK